MRDVLDAVMFLVALGILSGALPQARNALRGPGRPRGQSRKGGWLEHRREMRRIHAKAEQDRLRDQAKHGQQMERERLRAERDRENRWRREGDGEGPRERVRRTIRLKPDGTAAPDDPGAPGGGASDLAGDPDKPPPASRPSPPRPAREPAPAPAQATARPPREEPPVTSPAIRTGIEDLITAIDRIRAGAAAGNAQAKLAALKACSAACSRFAAMALMLGRQMTEQGHYGPEITERISAAGTHLTAAASAFSDSANGLGTLLNLRLGEMPQSGRQAPHHAELSETGAR